jgi:beta-N-acetylhexosaminidase
VSIPKAVILSCVGTSLTADERRLFGQANPFGLILFKRNIDNPSQVLALTQEFRSCVGRADAPVLLDQEGGRVARLQPPHWEIFPPAAAIGELYTRDTARGLAAAKLLGRLLAAQLLPLGITVDCTPVCDLQFPKADAVIGDRAFGSDPHKVALLSRAVCDGLRVGGVLPVIKHIPGHGRAMADSHLELPVVETAAEELQNSDFAPFRELRDMPLAMTAHIKYSALDTQNCATLSPKIIAEVIREQIGFQGLLMSDDVTMKALNGSLPELSLASIKAGCDIALYCKDSVPDMTAICEAVPTLSLDAQLRWKNAQTWLRPMELFDPKLARAEFNQFFPDFAHAKSA